MVAGVSAINLRDYLFYEEPGITLYVGDALTVLRELPGESVQTCVTSPPYWGLRDYGTATWEGGDDGCKHSARLGDLRFSHPISEKQRSNAGSAGSAGSACLTCGARHIDAQLGLEKTPEAYVAALVAVFAEVRRVLREDGTLWLNLGDSYANTGGMTGGMNSKEGSPARAARMFSGAYRALSTGLKQKDLVGIPWRVAFALQAPEYQGRIREEKHRTWLSALVDGEGCITILQTTSPHGSGDSFPPVLQVRMCDPGPIEHAALITGIGVASPRQDPPSHGGNHGSYQWRLSGQRAADIAAELYPYLPAKRKQALIAWNHQEVRRSYHVKRGVRIPEAALAKAQVCRDLIRRANKREPVDIPDWMQEPPPMFRPGWYLRSDCIWAKPNPMPESVTDRPTRAHEYLFLLARSERYVYDYKAVAEAGVDAAGVSRGGSLSRFGRDEKLVSANAHRGTQEYTSTGRRNRRSVWTIATEPYPETHFAVFPPDLITPCILAGCPVGGTVLDPFCGSGTTLYVAKELNRQALGIDLNADYGGLAVKRLRQEVLPLGGASHKT